MKISLLSFFVLLLFKVSIAQQPCGTYEYENYLNSKYPGFSEALAKTRQNSIAQINALNKTSGNDTVYRIPVVFHIVWNTNEQNIHDSFIYSQIKVINGAYRHNHKDTGAVRDLFKPLAGDSKIEFYLSDKDPNGNPTMGINRVKPNRTDFNNGIDLYGEAVKSTASQGIDAWDPTKYLNIWVCKFTFRGSLAVAAYAYPPVDAKNWSSTYYKALALQGVVTNYQFVGTDNPYDKSIGSTRDRTLVHEIGHFLGLRHIWADKTQCVGEDDGLKDTPNCRIATRECSIIQNTCIENNDKPDMTENYMDYTPFPCTVMFTKEQVELMRYNLINLRKDLYQLKVSYGPTVSENIVISPNPVLDVIKIKFVEKGLYQLAITDMIGQAVVEEPINVGDSYSYNYSSQDLAPGIYYLSIMLDNHTMHQQKIIIQQR